ncbi:MAG: formimidoylglutamase, partial [Bdellovibrionota bacterium]|nr:formimidoylglutamase [Bdellovibrionota bacterium]
MGSYQKTDATIWTGREDKGERFFNKVKVVDLLKNELPLLSKGGTSFALLGFCSDEGVRRNQGRVGSKDGPLALRKALRNKCFHNFND